MVAAHAILQHNCSPLFSGSVLGAWLPRVPMLPCAWISDEHCETVTWAVCVICIASPSHQSWPAHSLIGSQPQYFCSFLIHYLCQVNHAIDFHARFNPFLCRKHLCSNSALVMGSLCHIMGISQYFGFCSWYNVIQGWGCPDSRSRYTCEAKVVHLSCQFWFQNNSDINEIHTTSGGLWWI